MKKLKIEILEKYKAYEKDACYELEGDLIIYRALMVVVKASCFKLLRRIVMKKLTDELPKSLMMVQ